MSWPPRDKEHIDSTQVRNYMQSVMAWMDGTEWVERYYWYGARWDMVSSTRAERAERVRRRVQEAQRVPSPWRTSFPKYWVKGCCEQVRCELITVRV